MKTFTSIIFMFVLILTNQISAQQWWNVGTPGFSAGQANFTSLAIDGSGTPYVAYSDGGNTNKATVMKYDGSSWVVVGTPGFSAGQANNPSLVINGSGTPYVAYQDLGNSTKATVMKYDGSSWVVVGTPGFSAGGANFTSLAIDGSGTPYVAYQDVGNSGKATVMKYNGISWVVVGTPGFSASQAIFHSLVIDGSGTPYVAYQDYGNTNKVTVMKYDGSSWVVVGTPGFSAGQANNPSLAINGSGTPYVAYMDGGNTSKATVMKYNGSSWVVVGTAGFSAGQAGTPSLTIDGSGTPYVAYGDGNTSKATVMKYDGSSWVVVGTAGFSAGQAIYSSLVIDGSGTPYVAYKDVGNSSKATVMKYSINQSDPLGSIGGIKFNDLNGNGIKDPGEPGLPGWEINLTYQQATGTVTLTNTTDTNGNYYFDNLQPGGTYTVAEVQQTGWTPTTSVSQTVTVVAGQTVTVNFGNHKGDCVPPPDSMVAWWPLDETSGSTSIDLAGYNNTGTHTNGPVPVSAKVLGGLMFDGINDYVEVPDQSELNFGIGDFSFDAWIQTTDSVGAQDLVDKRTSSTGFIGYSFFLNNGKLSLQMADGSFTSYTSPVFVADGQWHHIAITVSRTDSRGIHFYLDGVDTQFGDPTLHPGSLDNKVPLRIGSQSFSVNYLFKGVLDEIELFNRVLSATEIQAIYNAGSAGKCKPPDSLGTIIGTKFNDLNENGVQDGNETGIPGWTINLSGPVTGSTTTNSSGDYSFNNLSPGTYTVTEVQQSGWTPTTSVSQTVTVVAGQTVTVSFGNHKGDCVPPPDSMVAWWPLDETSGSTSIDLAGYNNTGTHTNGPVPVSAKVLGGLMFDGINDYVEVPDQSELNFGTGDFSFDAWIQTTDSVGAQDLVDKRTSSTGYIGYSFFLNNGKLSLQMADGSFTSYASPVFVADGQWHHIAITVSRTDSRGIHFYLDGVDTQFGDPTLHPGSLNNKGPLRIGSQSFSVNYLFKGVLDEIELFNRVLSATEIQSIYNAGSAGKCKSPVTGIKRSSQIPSEFALLQNYPNPFNPSTTFRYQLPQAANVQLIIYNTLGQVVRRLVNSQQAAGEYETMWDGKDYTGRTVASGVYLYRIQAGDFVQTRKMLLLK